MPVLFILFMSAFSGLHAQYFVDFEGAGETKTAYASGTLILNGLQWNMTEALVGTSASDWKNGARSTRMRGYAASSITMLDDYPYGLGTLSFYYRRYGTDNQVDWKVEYSTNGGADWTQAGSDFTAPATDDVQLFSETLDITGAVRIRILRATLSGSSNARLNIDDILLTDGPPDLDPPVWTDGYPYLKNIRDNKGTVVANMNEKGKVYSVVMPDGATPPTSTEVKEAVVDGMNFFVKETVDVLQPGTDYEVILSGAQPETAYDIYVVAEDNALTPNLQTAPVLLEATTTATRELTILTPQPEDSYYVGDTEDVTWTSANIDSLYVGAYVYEYDEYVILSETGDGTPYAVDAAAGVFPLPIPLHANVDSVAIVLWDATDTSYYVMTGPVYLVDTIAPRILELIPADDHTDVPLHNTFVIVFTEEVFPGSGDIRLKKADGTLVETFPLASVQQEDQFIAFRPTGLLEPGVSYYIEIDAGIVVDWKDLPFKGIADDATWNFTASSADLYFSEYIEGLSNNQGLEIFNPTGETVNLSQYKILGNYNGGQFMESNSLVLPEMELASGEVFAITRSDAAQALRDAADLVVVNGSGPGQTYLMGFTGDDARALAKLVWGSWDDEHLYAIVDVIGEEGFDPGTAWDVAGETEATANHTLLRKQGILIGNPDWESSAGTSKEDSEWKVFPTDFFDNFGFPTPTASDETEILGLGLSDTTGHNVTTGVVIDPEAFTVDVEVLFGLDDMLDSLVPGFILSDGATISPASGDTIDFTSPVQFTVTAEDMITTQVWTVTVTVAATASSEKKILSFEIEGITEDAVIDAGNHTVSMVLPFGTDLTALVPVIEISAGATISPESGVAQDFSSPVEYTVTAQDASVQVWTVTITAITPDIVSIYDIQHTTLPSGDSPLAGSFVQVTGIVAVSNNYGYFLQDAPGAWNGIYVYEPGRAPAMGDNVTVVGTVSEYYNETEIEWVESFTLNSSGNEPHEAALINTSDMGEAWEGVLVRVEDVAAVTAPNQYGEWWAKAGSDSVMIDDRYYQYTPVVGNVYNITGAVTYNYGDFKILPRFAADLEDITGIAGAEFSWNIRLYPNPAPGILTLELSRAETGDMVVEMISLTGKVVFHEILHGSASYVLPIDVSGEARGTYLLRIIHSQGVATRKVMIF